MSEQSDLEQPPAEGSGPKHIAKNVGTALGCLGLLVLTVIVGFGMVGMFVGDPAFWMAFVALCVAVAAFKASRRRR